MRLLRWTFATSVLALVLMLSMMIGGAYAQSTTGNCVLFWGSTGNAANPTCSASPLFGSGSTGFGYAPAQAVGGAITQGAGVRTTAVTLSTLAGTITTNNTSLGPELAAVFVVTNTLVGANDVVVVSQKSGSNGGNTDVYVSAIAAGSFSITVANNNAAAGTAETGAILINFVVIKGTVT